MKAQSYIYRIIFFVIVISMMVVTANFFVDPYSITHAKRISGFNKHKVDIGNYVRLSKSYHPLFNQHNALVVGNSRVEMGINPSHYCFAKSGWDLYNLGIPGAGVGRQLEYALNIIYQQPIDKILLSVDFTDFLEATQVEEQGSASLLSRSTGKLQYLPGGSVNPNYLSIRFMDYYRALYSLDALLSSLKTVTLQSMPGADRDESGFNPARDFSASVSIEGPGALFDQKMHVLEKKYKKKWYLHDASGKLNQSFSDLSAFLSLASTRNIEVVVFTNPFHEKYWDLLEKSGLSLLYEDWLQSISELVTSFDGEKVALWNFSQDSPYIHEAVPARGVKAGPLNWFWEPAHYRAQLGDLMVEAMLSGTCASEVKFGQKISE